MTKPSTVPDLDIEILRCKIRKEYTEVATNPQKDFHFHTGKTLADLLGYAERWVEAVPVESLDSFAGTGNPFSLGEIRPGEKVIDVGSGAGFDSLIAANMSGPMGQVIGVDMTPQMLAKARASADPAGLTQLEFREGQAENLSVPSSWADVVISNGVINLCPDKLAVFQEVYRVLKPGGRLQIGDILIQKAVPDSAKRDIDLWTG